MIVAIGRELGAGGLSVGEALARDLGACLLDERMLVGELSRRGGFSAEYLQRIDEQPPSLASSFLRDIARAAALADAADARSPEGAVHDEIRAVVLERARRGHAVLIGHGGAKLLEGHVARGEIFSLLLHAGRPWRVRRVMERFAIDRAEAEERVRRTDELRRRYCAYFFSLDLYDAHNYDLVIDTERVGIASAIRIATEAVRAALPVSAHS
ncbi:MAG TPA: cytidylate kinase-like family protein [Verrucomicrobiae bacterium]|nr:cytidylate kinase-like family protein [Verrucomicrobiae bacterium]